jgi:cytochrome c peroxidase
MKKIIIFLAGLLFAGSLIKPIPEKIEYNKQKALLGKLLYFDTNLSLDRTISCASCHIPKFGWADPRKVSIGVYGRKGSIQSPTVLNAVFNFRQFWNGRAKDLKEQMNGPFHNPVEMGMSNELLIKRVKENKKYVKLFKKIYHTDNITYDMIVDAIAEFETALITPNSKFDLYLKGKAKLSSIEKDGFLVFKKYGCITCHNGINVGGNSFQKMGVIYPLKECKGDRYEITHNPLDRCVYKVPSLRNIALTAPYFHNGSAKNLKEAIEIMAKKNLGMYFTEYEKKALEAFLKTLTGKTPEIMRDRK